MAEFQPLVGIINSRPNIIPQIEEEIRRKGFRTATLDWNRVKVDPESYVAFLLRHKPDVVVLDVPAPIKRNWAFTKVLTRLPESEGTLFMYTTRDSVRNGRAALAIGAFRLSKYHPAFVDLARNVADTYDLSWNLDKIASY
jgi:hypothetical protein